MGYRPAFLICKGAGKCSNPNGGGVSSYTYVVPLDSQTCYHLGLLLNKEQPSGGRSDTVGSVQAHLSPYFSGLTAGQRWHWLPGSYQLNGLQLQNDVPVELQWNLLGISMYTQLKRYRGTTVLH